MNDVSSPSAMPSSWDWARVRELNFAFHEIPWEARTVAHIWRGAVARCTDQAFVGFNGDAAMSYRDVDRSARAWSAVFAKLGLEAGARAAVMLPNSAEHLAVWLGALTSSIVVVPINYAFRGEMLRHVLADSKCVVIVASPEAARAVRDDWVLDHLDVVVLADGGEVGDVQGTRQYLSASNLLAGVEPAGDLAAPRPDSVAAVLYTSGTTGPSKGAVVSQQYFVYSAWAFAQANHVDANDVLFSVLPMFHVNPYVCTLIPAMMTSARAVVYRSFSASRFWDQVADSGATHFVAMGTIGNILMKRPVDEFRDDHRLRLCQIVPAPDDLPEFERRFHVSVLYAMFGMTEGLMVRPTRDGSHRPGLIGAPDQYHEIAVVDDADLEVQAGVEGELVVRPRIPGIIFSEYLGRPEATVAAFRNLWFHTGDLAVRDAQGELWFRGRKKDAIRRRGENVSAFEVEREALRCADVADAAAIGVDSDLGEEEVMLVVAAAPGREISPVDLHAFLVSALPTFMVPRYISVLDALPKNDSQRVVKDRLREEVDSGAAWDAETAATTVRSAR